jgi:hypothetical protein
MGIMINRRTVEFTMNGQPTPAAQWDLCPPPTDSGGGPSKPNARENAQRPDKSSDVVDPIPSTGKGRQDSGSKN